MFFTDFNNFLVTYLLLQKFSFYKIIWMAKEAFILI